MSVIHSGEISNLQVNIIENIRPLSNNSQQKNEMEASRDRNSAQALPEPSANSLILCESSNKFQMPNIENAEVAHSDLVENVRFSEAATKYERKRQGGVSAIQSTQASKKSKINVRKHMRKD